VEIANFTKYCPGEAVAFKTYAYTRGHNTLVCGIVEGFVSVAGHSYVNIRRMSGDNIGVIAHVSKDNIMKRLSREEFVAMRLEDPVKVDMLDEK
jgi:hypothetical protein